MGLWINLRWGQLAPGAAPVLDHVNAFTTGITTATVLVSSTQHNGTVYSVGSLTDDEPTVEQIVAGENANGDPTPNKSQPVTVLGQQQLDYTGLTTSESYRFYTVHIDAAGRTSNIVMSNTIVIDSAPILAAQELAYGALTLPGDGGQTPVTTGGAAASFTIETPDPVNPGHWVFVGLQLVPTALYKSEGAASSYTLGIVAHNDIGSSTEEALTVTTIPNWYSVVPDPSGLEAELSAACDDMKTLYNGGKTIGMLPGQHRLPQDNATLGRKAGVNRNWGNLVTVTTQGSFGDFEFINWAVGTRSTLRAWHNVLCIGVKFHAVNDGLTVFSSASGFIITSPNNTLFEDVEWYGDRTNFSLAAIEAGQSDYSILVNHGSGSSPISGLYHHKNCTFRGANGLLELPVTNSSQPAGQIIIEGCNFSNFGLDCIRMTGQQWNLFIVFSQFHSPYTYTGYAGHGDYIQLSPGNADSGGMYIAGNAFVSMREVDIGQKRSYQLVFLQTGLVGSVNTQTNTQVIGNIGASPMAQGVWSDRVGMVNSKIIANTFAGISPTGGTNQPYVNLQGGSGNIITRNAMFSFSGSGAVGEYNNQVIRGDQVGTAGSYDTNFVGIGGSFVPINIAELETMFAPKPGSVLDTDGIGAQFVDRTLRIIDVPELNEATWTPIADVTGATVSAVVTSEPQQISILRDVTWQVGSNSPVSVNGGMVSVSGGINPEFRVTSDEAGTNELIGWTDVSQIMQTAGYMWLRDNASPDAATETQITIQIGADTQVWSITTA